MPRPLVEIAVDNLPDALAAAELGIDRLELCSALAGHGLTASTRVLADLRMRSTIPVAAMVRPRVGNFVASPSDRFLAPRQAESLLAAGADAIVFGFLDADGNIDLELCAQMVHIAGAAHVVFHRGFDMAPAPLIALDQLIDLGVRRVLTAGMSPAATACALGIAQHPFPPDSFDTRLANLKRYVGHAAERIEIIPCGGIRAANAQRILTRTGVSQLHSACRTPGSESLDPQQVRDLLDAVAAP